MLSSSSAAGLCWLRLPALLLQSNAISTLKIDILLDAISRAPGPPLLPKPLCHSPAIRSGQFLIV